FNEKRKIIYLLQMFINRESIADRIQHELIRLTNHPKAKAIAKQIIENEYATFKSKTLVEIINEDQFDSFKVTVADLLMNYVNIDNISNRPLKEVMPEFIIFLKTKISKQSKETIIDKGSKHISQHNKRITQKK